ncbi:hypothetical protein QZH41_006247 [Actinostola sp. cb2023]|nr:hypothetical protein QZH41_006247 [Actinostola sp. cb2023]
MWSLRLSCKCFLKILPNEKEWAACVFCLWQFIKDVGKQESYNVKEFIVSKNANIPFLTELQILQGLSLGYGLLCPCLRNMTVRDYSSLAESFDLLRCHPLLAAYISAQEAAKSSTYTPMFFVRHICHAGEVMLQFVKLSTLREEKHQLLRVAIEDLKDSIQAHQTYKSLTSKEQFYIFVLASYKLSLALLQRQSKVDQETGNSLKAISVKLYEHYCSSSGYVLIDDRVTGLIHKCLALLGLEKYLNENLPNAGQVLSNYYKRRSTKRLEENTRLTVEGLFANGQAHASPVSPDSSLLSSSWLQQQELDSTNFSGKSSVRHGGGSTVDRKATPAADPGRPRDDKTVDRSAVTVEQDEEVTPVADPGRPRDDKTVDRSAVTVEQDEEEVTPAADPGRPRDDKTVDRSAVTVEQDEEVTPVADPGRPRDDKTVDRSAVTVEQDEEEVTPAADPGRPRDDKTVDRSAVTVEQDEEEVTPVADPGRPRDDKTVDRSAVTVEQDEEVTPVADPGRPRDDKTVDRSAVTVEQDEEEVTPAAEPGRPRDDKTVDRSAVTVEQDEEEVTPAAEPGRPRDDKTVDRSAVTVEKVEQLAIEDNYMKISIEQKKRKTVDEYAFLISRTVEDDSGVIVQSLEDEAVSLPSQTHDIPMAGHRDCQEYDTETSEDKEPKARDAILWKYDYLSSQWRGQPTMVYIGDLLKLEKGMEGAQRDVFEAKFINQDEPLGRYVAKKYRKKIHLQQYENDVLSQMTARQYVALFNQSLSKAVADCIGLHKKGSNLAQYSLQNTVGYSLLAEDAKIRRMSETERGSFVKQSRTRFKECLYHAYMQNDFQKLAALVLVLDRFMYWHGDTKRTMDVVDYIQKNSPETAIAPQLVIRRARFMKNEGNLREAEATLDKLLQAREKIGQWKYREDHEFQLVSGVCVQIKGEIQYRLGHWREAASLLVSSIEFFKSLPQPDKKGLAASYGLLSLCLYNMTINEYLALAHSLGLLQCHPLLAAYFSAQKASKSSVYTPMFFLRHSCQAGEVMLAFVKLATTGHEKQQLLRVAIEDLKDSIQAHQTYKSLTSREQFYVLVCACYKLYEHYCSCCGHVLIDNHITGLIDKCLTLLGLEKFQNENLPNAGQVLLKYYNRRSAERLKENTCLISVELFAGPQPILSGDSFEQPTPREPPIRDQEDKVVIPLNTADSEEIVDRCAATAESQEDKDVIPLNAADSEEIVDRCAATAESQEDKDVIPLNAADSEEIVDRCAATAESQEDKDVIPLNAADSEEIVDRCAATAESQEDKDVIPLNAADSEEIVDRCAATAETQEDKDVIPLNAADSEEIVDRCAATAESQEDKDVIPLNAADSEEIVDRCAATAESQEDKDVIPLNAADSEEIVDRCAATAESQEDKDVIPLNTADSEEIVDRCAATAESQEDKDVIPLNAADSEEIVDRCVATAESQEAKDVIPLNAADSEEIVDRCAATAESQEDKDVIPLNAADSEEIVDRCAATAESQEDKDVIPLNAADSEEIVDRCAATAESQEDKDVIPLNAADSEEIVDRCAATAESQEDKDVIPLNAADSEEIVDRCAATAESQEDKDVIPLNAADSEEIVDRCAATAESQEDKDVIPLNAADSEEIVDRCAATAESQDNFVVPIAERVKSVDECVRLIGHTDNNLPSGIIVQSLEDEAVSLPSRTNQIPIAGHRDDKGCDTKTKKDKGKRVQDAILWKYDFASSQWRGQPTMAFIGDPLKLDKGKQGTQRDVFTIEFINQEEPLGSDYVIKEMVNALAVRPSTYGALWNLGEHS